MCYPLVELVGYFHQHIQSFEYEQSWDGGEKFEKREKRNLRFLSVWRIPFFLKCSNLDEEKYAEKHIVAFIIAFRIDSSVVVMQ